MEALALTDPANPRPTTLRVERTEHALQLVMPIAKPPLAVEGVLTFGDATLATTIAGCEQRAQQLFRKALRSSEA
jgi:hypothetical protein